MKPRTLAGRIAGQSSLLRYNAKRCEQSKHPACRCRCRGMLHGKPHGAPWLAQQLENIKAEENARERALPTRDLLLPPPKEPPP